MWFKQIQVFQISLPIHLQVDTITPKLAQLAFSPCLPSLSETAGWVSPVEDTDDLLRNVNGNWMLCLQFEEKILPATVVSQAVAEKVKQIEKTRDRKVRQKEKLSLKDEVTITLLPRAFSRLSRVYAYVDTKNQWLVIGTANAGKTEKFIDLFKKTVTDQIVPFDVKKTAITMTHWLQHQSHPSTFAIEKSCVLQDPNQEKRVIRCQNQDLFAGSIQSLLKDGCAVKQLALSWQDRVHFLLTTEFVINALTFGDEITAQTDEIEAETREQRFDTDFFIMGETLAALLNELLSLLVIPTTAAPGAA